MPIAIARAALPCLLVAMLAGCATPAPQRSAHDDDTLCAELVAFANDVVEDGGSHEVAFMTDWGGHGSRDDDEDVLFATRCDHDPYEPGRRLCAYLMEHASIEFPAANVRAVLACLEATDDNARELPPGLPFRKRGPPNMPVNVEVRVDFREATDLRPPTLVISARR